MALNQHPKYPVIICANRDEFHQRPTQEMHVWETPDILAGKDLQAGGTWLGVTNTLSQPNSPVGFSALTNYRQVTENNSALSEHTLSRGELVVRALQTPAGSMTAALEDGSDRYQGFNLVYGQLSGNKSTLYCYDSRLKKSTLLQDGVHSLCNGALDDIWPKMAKGQSLLENYIKSNHAIETQSLFQLMRNADIASDDELPKTGVPIEWERRLSAIFVQSPEYGTRSTCIILLDKQGSVHIEQQEFNPLGETISHQIFDI